MILSSCGVVEKAEYQNLSDSTGFSDTESKKRSGFGEDANNGSSSEEKNDSEETTTGPLPVFAPPENGSVAENTNTKKKDKDKDKEETETTAADKSDDSKAQRKPPKNPSPSELLEYMTLEEKVCQMFIVEPEALAGYNDTSGGEDTKTGINNHPVGGVIYFSRNLLDRSQTSEMINSTQGYSKEKIGTGVFIAVDEEGGTVSRCSESLGTASFSDMVFYGEGNDGSTAYNIGSTIGNDLKGLGFNLDFAPVADVNVNPMNELGNRIFSSDPNVVANMAGNVIKGLQDSGVCATAKHFPGLGAEGGNTHEDSYVVVDRTREQLRETEFIPFKKAIENGVRFIMVGHQITTCAGDNLPGDLSYEVCTGMLRNELGFNGIIVSDSQKMNTISNVYSSGDAAVMSIKAGVDMILIPYDLSAAVNGVCDAVKSGNISESRIDESVMRILELKYSMGIM